MEITVYSLLGVLQDLYHQPYNNYNNQNARYAVYTHTDYVLRKIVTIIAPRKTIIKLRFGPAHKTQVYKQTMHLKTQH